MEHCRHGVTEQIWRWSYNHQRCPCLSLNDLTLSTATANAHGVYSPTGGSLADPQLTRTSTMRPSLQENIILHRLQIHRCPSKWVHHCRCKGKAIVLAWTTATEKIITVSRSNGARMRRVFDNHGQKSVRRGTRHNTITSIYVFADNTAAGLCSYRLKQIDKDGRCEYSSTVDAAAILSAADYSLAQNYPNHSIPRRIFISLWKLHSTRRWKCIIPSSGCGNPFDGLQKKYDAHFLFDASRFASGTYFYALHSTEKTDVKKMHYWGEWNCVVVCSRRVSLVFYITKLGVCRNGCRPFFMAFRLYWHWKPCQNIRKQCHRSM